MADASVYLLSNLTLFLPFFIWLHPPPPPPQPQLPTGLGSSLLPTQREETLERGYDGDFSGCVPLRAVEELWGLEPTDDRKKLCRWIHREFRRWMHRVSQMNAQGISQMNAQGISQMNAQGFTDECTGNFADECTGNFAWHKCCLLRLLDDVSGQHDLQQEESEGEGCHQEDAGEGGGQFKGTVS